MRERVDPWGIEWRVFCIPCSKKPYTYSRTCKRCGAEVVRDCDDDTTAEEIVAQFEAWDAAGWTVGVVDEEKNWTGRLCPACAREAGLI